MNTKRFNPQMRNVAGFRLFDIALLFLCGMPMSQFGSANVFNFGGRFFPEFFFIPWFGLLFLSSPARRRHLIHFFSTKMVLTTFYLFSLIAIVGLLRFDAEFLNFYARYRALFLAMTGALVIYFVQKKADQRETIWLAVIIILLGNCVFGLIDNNVGTKHAIPAMGFMICVIFFTERKMPLVAILVLGLFAYATVISFFRVNYGVFFLTAMYVLLHAVLGLNKSNVSGSKGGMSKASLVGLLAILISTAFLVTNWGLVYDFLSATPSRYAQSIAKYNALIEGLERGSIGNSSDVSRLEGLKFFFNNFMAFLLPNGIVNDSSLWNFSLWGGSRFSSNANLARDSVFAYTIQFLGFGLAIPIGVLCALSASLALLQSPKLIDAIRTTFLLFAFLLLFTVDGLVLTQFERSFQYGVAFALCFPIFKRKVVW